MGCINDDTIFKIKSLLSIELQMEDLDIISIMLSNWIHSLRLFSDLHYNYRHRLNNKACAPGYVEVFDEQFARILHYKLSPVVDDHYEICVKHRSSNGTTYNNYGSFYPHISSPGVVDDSFVLLIYILMGTKYNCINGNVLTELIKNKPVGRLSVITVLCLMAGISNEQVFRLLFSSISYKVLSDISLITIDRTICGMDTDIFNVFLDVYCLDVGSALHVYYRNMDIIHINNMRRMLLKYGDDQLKVIHSKVIEYDIKNEIILNLNDVETDTDDETVMYSDALGLKVRYNTLCVD